MSPYTLLSALALATPAAASQAPNVLVVLLDDVGHDKIGFAGAHPQPAPTPNLDRLAARGVVFENAWACPSCSPTRASLLSGQYSTRNGIGQVMRAGDGVDTPLDPNTFTLADALPDHHSVLLGKWHLDDSTTPAAHALSCGFDAALTYDGGNGYTDWLEDLNGVQTQRTGYYPTALASVAHRAVRELPEPYFVYYAPFLAHAPFHDPPPALCPLSPAPATIPDTHRTMVEAADTLVGRVLNEVDLDRTYVFVLGDNGSPPASIDGPFDSGRAKSTVYEGGLRVPFVVAGPGVAEGARCEALVQVTDVLATCRTLVGLGPAPTGAEDSVSFAHLLLDPAAQGHRDFLYAHKFPFPGAISNGPSAGPARAIRTQRWKLVELDGTRHELYDLEADPGELVDLLTVAPSPAHRAIKNRLLDLMPPFP